MLTVYKIPSDFDEFLVSLYKVKYGADYKLKILEFCGITPEPGFEFIYESKTSNGFILLNIMKVNPDLSVKLLSNFDTGIIYAPYIPLQITKVIS